MDDSNFIQNSLLDILIPQDSEYDIENMIKPANINEHTELNNTRFFPFIARRNVLHFDESIFVCIVLRTPYLDERQLGFFVSRLNISIEAHAFSSSRPLSDHEASKDNFSPQNMDVIWSSKVNTDEEPVIVVQQNDSQDENPYVYIVWKMLAYLSRPRIRLQSPMIVFRPLAVLGLPKLHPIDESKDAYLPSGVPMSLNLFESLKGDPVLQGVEPQLSAFRLSHINPSDYGSKIGEQFLKVLSPIAFHAIPALSAKVRYSSSSAYMGRPTVIASLDIEAAPFFDNDVVISAIGMQLSEGIAKDLSTGSGVMLPMRCRPKDNTIFLFHLISADDSSHRSTTNPTSRILEITISADVLVSKTCRPHIEMRWKTGVDFSIALNPSYGAPGQSLQRSKRPASLPMTPSTSGHGETPTAQEGEHTGITSNQIRQRTLSVSDLSFTITFTSPSEVRVGEPFSCDMFIVNRSSKPRKLAVTVIPKRRRGEMKGHLSRPSASSIGSRRDTENTDAVIDENLLYAMQKNAGKEVPNIVSLSSDVKIGTLNPGSCHNVDLKFLPLAKGVLQIEAIRVTDVTSNDSIDIRDLPDILAADRAVDG